MQLPLKIAILECDTPLPNTKSQYGGYGGVFEILLKAGAKALGRPDPETGLLMTKYQIEDYPDIYPSLDDIDAVLITGSRHDAHADIPWTNKLVEFTAKVLSQSRVRMIGVCFGHQIIARAMGIKVGRNADGWEAAVNTVQLSPKGKELFGLDILRIHHMHRDIVYYLPEGVELLGSSPVCEIQGMYSRNRFITTQGHPEFNRGIIQELIDTRHATGIFDDEAYKAHVKKVPLPHDGVVVSKAFIEFLLVD